MHPLRFIRYLARRLCRWVYEPTPEEKLRTVFELGKVAERNEQLHLPIARAQNTGPIVQLPENLCWPTMKWSRHFFTEVRPDLYRPGIRLTVRLEPLSEEETAKYETMPKFLK